MSGGFLSSFYPITPRAVTATLHAEDHAGFQAAATTAGGDGGDAEYAVLSVQGEGITVYDTASTHPLFARPLPLSALLASPAVFLPLPSVPSPSATPTATPASSSTSTSTPRGILLAPLASHPSSIPSSDAGKHVWMYKCSALSGSSAPDSTLVLDKPIQSILAAPPALASRLDIDTDTHAPPAYTDPSPSPALFLAYHTDASFSLYDANTHSPSPSTPIATSSTLNLDATVSSARTTRLQSRLRRRALWAALCTIAHDSPSTSFAAGGTGGAGGSAGDTVVVDVFDTELPDASSSAFPDSPLPTTISTPSSASRRRSSVALHSNSHSHSETHPPSSPLSTVAVSGTPHRRARDSSPFASPLPSTSPLGAPTTLTPATPSRKPSSSATTAPSAASQTHHPYLRIRALTGPRGRYAEVQVDVGREGSRGVRAWDVGGDRGLLAALAPPSLLLFRLPHLSSPPPPAPIKPHLVIPLSAFFGGVPTPLVSGGGSDTTPTLTPTATSIKFVDANHVAVGIVAGGSGETRWQDQNEASQEAALAQGQAGDKDSDAFAAVAHVVACDLRFAAPRGVAAVFPVGNPSQAQTQDREDAEAKATVAMGVLPSGRVVVVHCSTLPGAPSTSATAASTRISATLHSAPTSFPLPTLSGAVSALRAITSPPTQGHTAITAPAAIPDADADVKRWIKKLAHRRDKADAVAFDAVMKEAPNGWWDDSKVVDVVVGLALAPIVPTVPGSGTGTGAAPPPLFRPRGALIHLTRAQRLSLRTRIGSMSVWETVLAWDDPYLVESVVSAGGFADGTDGERARGIAWAASGKGGLDGWGGRSAVLKALCEVGGDGRGLAVGLAKWVQGEHVSKLVDYLVAALEGSSGRHVNVPSQVTAAVVLSAVLDAHARTALVDPACRAAVVRGRNAVHALCDDHKRTDEVLRGVFVAVANAKGKAKELEKQKEKEMEEFAARYGGRVGGDGKDKGKGKKGKGKGKGKKGKKETQAEYHYRNLGRLARQAAGDGVGGVGYGVELLKL
ncbi:hypothetical protein M427DRAFT_44172 [Gonapodya prolifera JEL478]|uniref:Uncharacterized protein n=1 Tax=Gonapodya prolifera (strain JEL478) TaxID=1344416 RepID=A0A139AH21_GONPJ|nr:hypothetical protein M427DRAFT_44172 [Gonapodya prolifera JEL478]|eukprot:KXS16038.1 hypothetical protein M427DRAFT_44172 [Gonapodya prolifera JEL478]